MLARKHEWRRVCGYPLLFCIYYYCCRCTACTALLFSSSAIFIAASVRNKLIHSSVRCSSSVLTSVQSDTTELSYRVASGTSVQFSSFAINRALSFVHPKITLSAHWSYCVFATSGCSRASSSKRRCSPCDPSVV